MDIIELKILHTYKIKLFFSFLKDNSIQFANIIFFEDELQIYSNKNKNDQNKHVFSTGQILGNEMEKYKVNKKLFNDKENNCHRIQIDIEKFTKEIEKINKNNTTHLIINNDEIKVIFENTISKVDILDYIDNNLYRDYQKPSLVNYKLRMDIFVNDLKSFHNKKNKLGGKFKIFEEGLEIYLYQNKKDNFINTKYGETDNEDYYSVEVDSNSIEQLKKLSSINKNCIVRFSSNTDNFICIEYALDCIGTHTIFLIN